MSNYGVQIGNLSTQEMPCLFLSTIFDINLVTAKNGYKSISSVEMYSKLNKFINDNQRSLVFLKFNGSQYIDKNYGIEVQGMNFELDARSGIDKFLQFKGSPFFNFKLYFQGYVYSKKPWKMDITYSATKAWFVYCPV